MKKAGNERTSSSSSTNFKKKVEEDKEVHFAKNQDININKIKRKREIKTTQKETTFL